MGTLRPLPVVTGLFTECVLRGARAASVMDLLKNSIIRREATVHVPRGLVHGCSEHRALPVVTGPCSAECVTRGARVRRMSSHCILIVMVFLNKIQHQKRGAQSWADWSMKSLNKGHSQSPLNHVLRSASCAGRACDESRLPAS